MYDNHIHTVFSPDGTADILNMVLTAVRLGVKEITITDHVDFDAPFWKDIPQAPLLDAYLAEIARVREEMDGIIKVHAGLEVGMMQQVIERTRNYLSSYALDFVLGSVHSLSTDYPNMHRSHEWGDITRQRGLEIYIEHILKLFGQYRDFDCIGHLTYLSRYGPFDGKEREMVASDAPEALAELFTFLIQNGKGIEINTSTVRLFGFSMPDISIVKLYRQMGGEIITIGSDAHNMRNIAAGYKHAVDILRHAGFEYVCTFEKRQPIFHRI
ncbi:histidinol-phosphatase HisJ family protein [Eubacteriales bacterium OttesenSCG-928-N14]|nr:histidinol-phosphatase HisJ family protein [Eubacteriales bacterium OttesenSCG-928-N14]